MRKPLKQVKVGEKFRLLVDLEDGESVDMLPIYTRIAWDKHGGYITIAPNRVLVWHAGSITTFRDEIDVEVVG